MIIITKSEMCMNYEDVVTEKTLFEILYNVIAIQASGLFEFSWKSNYKYLNASEYLLCVYNYAIYLNYVSI